MADDKNFAIEVNMTARRGGYGWESLGSREFRVEGPFETLGCLEVGYSLQRLYEELMLMLFDLLMTGEKEEDEE